MLKCAPAVPVVDCTERTNLRKYGTADMFFSYRAQVCLETHEEYSEMSSADVMRRAPQKRVSLKTASFQKRIVRRLMELQAG